jgi:hypothetical protein
VSKTRLRVDPRSYPEHGSLQRSLVQNAQGFGYGLSAPLTPAKRLKFRFGTYVCNKSGIDHHLENVQEDDGVILTAKDKMPA